MIPSMTVGEGTEHKMRETVNVVLFSAISFLCHWISKNTTGRSRSSKEFRSDFYLVPIEGGWFLLLCFQVKNGVGWEGRYRRAWKWAWDMVGGHITGVRPDLRTSS